MFPPRSVVPGGCWFCPACDPYLGKGGELKIAELRNAETPLVCHRFDPYRDQEFLDYIQSEHNLDLLVNLPPQLAAEYRRRGSFFAQHPSISDGLMVYKKIRGKPSRWLVFPPVVYRWDIIAMIHDVLAHPGVSQTVVVLHMHFHWPGIKADVDLFVRTCEPCQKLRASLPEPPRLQKPALFGPMDHIHIDLFGPIPRMLAKDKNGRHDKQKLWVVLMIDYFTKVAEFATVEDKTPLSVSKAFYNAWICRYGVPAVVTSDNGHEFSAEFVHMLSRLGIYHIQISPNHPSANGVVERLVRTVKGMLTKQYNDFPTDWTSSLPTVHQAYMSRKHTSICNLSPAEMLYGYVPKLPLAVRDVLVNVAEALSPEHHVCKLQDKLQEQYDRVARALDNAMHKNIVGQAHKLRGKRKCTDLEVGDLVLEVTNIAGPLQTGLKGPFKIVSINDTKTIAVLETGQTRFKERKHFKRHTSHLVKYHEPLCDWGGESAYFQGLQIYIFP